MKTGCNYAAVEDIFCSTTAAVKQRVLFLLLQVASCLKEAGKTRDSQMLLCVRSWASQVRHNTVQCSTVFPCTVQTISTVQCSTVQYQCEACEAQHRTMLLSLSSHMKHMRVCRRYKL
jgi:hypothetical protein